MDTAKKLHETQAPAEEKQPLEEALETVAADARQDPKGYLNDTRVPEGGE